MADLRFSLNVRRKGEPEYLYGMSYRTEDFDSTDELIDQIGHDITVLKEEQDEYDYRNEGRDDN